MGRLMEVLIGLAGLAVLTLAAFAAWWWWRGRRTRRIERWVKGYLVTRYGHVPEDLHVNCSDDQFWPLLVSFHCPHDRTLHLLEFGCSGPFSTFALLSERKEK
jgi:hypothetical protein